MTDLASPGIFLLRARWSSGGTDRSCGEERHGDRFRVWILRRTNSAEGHHRSGRRHNPRA